MLFIQHDNPCLLTRMLRPLQLVQLFELVVYVLLVFWGCHNKTPQYGWLKQQKLIFSGFWKLEVQDKGISMAGRSYGNCMQTTAHLGPHAVFPQRVLLVSLSQEHQSFWIRDLPLQPYLTLSSWRPHLQVQHHMNATEPSLLVVSTPATPWTATHQTPVPMESYRQGYWRDVPFSTPGDVPNPGIKPESSISCAGRQILYH